MSATITPRAGDASVAQTAHAGDARPGSPSIGDLRIALIGYGEVGGILGSALVARGVARVTAFDVVLADVTHALRMRECAERDGVRLADSPAAAIRGATLVISAVTASSTHAAAQSIAQSIARGAFLLDVNSASPHTKTQCAALVAAAGGRYVESAVMTSVPPYGIRVPMLLGGPDAAALAPMLAALGFDARVASERFGIASAIKMCRSVIVKGMEAIVIESFVTARRHGVEDAVLASLAETFPGLDWEKQGAYFFERVIKHGKRRAEEMGEAALTVREAGLEPLMAAATAERQAWVAELARGGVFDDAEGASWRALADRVVRGER